MPYCAFVIVVNSESLCLPGCPLADKALSSLRLVHPPVLIGRNAVRREPAPLPSLVLVLLLLLTVAGGTTGAWVRRWSLLVSGVVTSVLAGHEA